MIAVESLTQRYGSFKAVEAVSFELAPGEVVGFLGPNGAGKTTTLRVLATYLAPSAGKIRVGGFDAARQASEVRRILGYLPESCPLYETMTVQGFLEFVGKLRGMSRGDRLAASALVSERCQLKEVFLRPISELSKGYRQRVGLAQALLHDPPVLILDEPTSGLDPNQVQEIRALIRALGEERTVLFSSHILSEVEATCKRALVLHRGRLVADATLDDLKQQATGGAMEVGFLAPPADLSARLSALPEVAAVSPHGALLRVSPKPDQRTLSQRLFAFAQEANLVLTHLAPQQVTLEEVFASLTKEEHGQRLA